MVLVYQIKYIETCGCNVKKTQKTIFFKTLASLSRLNKMLRISAEWSRRWSRTASVHVGMHKAEQGGDIRFLFPPVRRFLPGLALSTTGSPRCFWNLAGVEIRDGTAPQGHLCDKWIKLDDVMLTAIGLCMSPNPKTRRWWCFIYFLNITLWPEIFLPLTYSFDVWEIKTLKERRVRLQRKHIS